MYNFTSLTECDKIAEMLIQRGADINYVSNDGETPLMLATRMGDEKTVPILIEHGANINATNFWGDPALILAASNSKNPL